MSNKAFAILLMIGVFLVGLPGVSAQGDTECCCFPTIGVLSKIEEFTDCLLNGNPNRHCGLCSAWYSGTAYGFGCKKDDDCDDPDELDCDEAGPTYNHWVMQGEPDTDICDLLEIGCECPLLESFDNFPGQIICNERYCTMHGVDCECP